MLSKSKISSSKWIPQRPVVESRQPHLNSEILAQHDISIGNARTQVTEQDFMMQITLSGWTKKMFMIGIDGTC